MHFSTCFKILNKMSLSTLLEHYFNKDGEEFAKNLRTLCTTFRDIRTPLLAGLLKTTKNNLDDSMRLIKKMYSASHDRKVKVSVFKLLNNYLSEDGEHFQHNLKELMVLFKTTPLVVLAGILQTKGTFNETKQLIERTMECVGQSKQNIKIFQTNGKIKKLETRRFREAKKQRLRSVNNEEKTREGKDVGREDKDKEEGSEQKNEKNEDGDVDKDVDMEEKEN